MQHAKKITHSLKMLTGVNGTTVNGAAVNETHVCNTAMTATEGFSNIASRLQLPLMFLSLVLAMKVVSLSRLTITPTDQRHLQASAYAVLLLITTVEMCWAAALLAEWFDGKPACQKS